MRGKIDQSAVFSNVLPGAEKCHERDQEDQEQVDRETQRDRSADLLRVSFQAFHDLRCGHDSREGKGDHPEQGKGIGQPLKAARQRA